MVCSPVLVHQKKKKKKLFSTECILNQHVYEYVSLQKLYYNVIYILPTPPHSRNLVKKIENSFS